MSGAEAGLVLGLITSTIALCQTAKQIYDTASSKAGLPEAFQKSAETLPLVLETLRAVEIVQNTAVEEQKVCRDDARVESIERSSRAAKHVVQTCRDNAETLKNIFDRVMAADGDSRRQRLVQAARSAKPGRSQKVEMLMKEVLEKLGLLQNYHVFKNMVTPANLNTAIQELNDIEPSVPDEQLSQYAHYGCGPMNIHAGEGEQNNKTQTGANSQMYNISNASGATFNFGGTK
jgi:hypothetical protein